jgi:hypothetical protein
MEPARPRAVLAAALLYSDRGEGAAAPLTRRFDIWIQGLGLVKCICLSNNFPR